jgi:hypothetical protein
MSHLWEAGVSYLFAARTAGPPGGCEPPDRSILDGHDRGGGVGFRAVEGVAGSAILGPQPVEAAAADVVVAPLRTPHAFRAVGPDALEMVNIHAAPRMETTWLEDRQPQP